MYWDFVSDGPGSVFKVAHCGNVTCTADNTLTRLDTVGNPQPFFSIAIGTDGLPVASFGEDLNVLHCGNVTCSAGNTLTTVDSRGDRGANASIAIGADGLPVMSYVKGAGDFTGALKVAHCGNPVSCK